MKLTAPVKLLTTPEQAELLKQSLRLANTACGHIAQRAFEHGVFGRFALQKLVYYDVRATVPLAAQVVVRCIAKVADAYTVSRRRVAAFKPLGALAYDRRILSWKLDAQTVSIWTVGGRQTIPFACGPRDRPGRPRGNPRAGNGSQAPARTPRQLVVCPAAPVHHVQGGAGRRPGGPRRSAGDEPELSALRALRHSQPSDARTILLCGLRIRWSGRPRGGAEHSRQGGRQPADGPAPELVAPLGRGRDKLPALARSR
jgi:hypothetical protein